MVEKFKIIFLLSISFLIIFFYYEYMLEGNDSFEQLSTNLGQSLISLVVHIVHVGLRLVKYTY